jgi:hypothetical protein
MAFQMDREQVRIVACALFVQPNKALSKKDELRFGSHGSLSVDLAKAIFYDHENGIGGGILDMIQIGNGKTGRDAVGWLESLGVKVDGNGDARAPKKYDAGKDRFKNIDFETPPPTFHEVCTYRYQNLDGSEAYQKVRRENGEIGEDGKKIKDFYFQHKVGNRYVRDIKGCARVPYMLPDLIAAIEAGRIIFIVEGEKCADLLRQILGCNATPDDITEYLKGADAVILPDNDDGGRDYAMTIAAKLAGVAKRIRILNLPGVGPKGDVEQWIDNGGTVEKLWELVDTAAKPADETIAAAKPNASGDDFKCNEHGQILKGYRRNIELAIGRLGVTLRKNEFSQNIEISGVAGFGPNLSDEGSIRLRFTIDETFKFLPAKDLYEDVLTNEAHKNCFHPVRVYLNKLSWDGVARLETWLSRYLGAEPSRYAQAIGPMFFVALVARVFDPGCKHDHMLVIEGPQGVPKSTACSVIAGGWFSDGLPDLREGKEVSQHLQGVWLIEMSELSAMRKADVETLKAFIARERDRYRPPYGRREVDQPRQCVFVGTTNEAVYLKDSTGGRRFWPIKASSIDLDALRLDRDQLFAEAVRSFHAGARWWPDKDLERELIKAEQDARYAQDLWHDDVLKYLIAKNRVTVGEVAERALYITDKSRLGTTENMRIIGIL